MTDLPDIDVVATVYFPEGEQGKLRCEGYERSQRTWSVHLDYPKPLRLITVNDGPELEPFATWGQPQISLGHDRAGVGASLNQGLREAFKDGHLVCQIDDDWLLTQDYDLEPWARMLMDDEAIGAVHLSAPYPGCTGTIEPRKHGWVVRMNRHNLVAGLRACLYHRRFFDYYGWFDLGLSAWETERLFNERFCRHDRGPESVLAIPVPWKEGIGAAVQLGQVAPHA
jgi:hypothetical protein